MLDLTLTSYMIYLSSLKEPICIFATLLGIIIVGWSIIAHLSEEYADSIPYPKGWVWVLFLISILVGILLPSPEAAISIALIESGYDAAPYIKELIERYKE